MDYDEIMMNAEERMESALEALGSAFASVRTGRANARVLDRIKVDYYGAATPINQLAGVKTPDARLLVIEPWDKSALKAIEKAIQESDLGVTPSNDGAVIRLPFPELTEERRRELAKQCKGYAEDARVSVRNARRDANTALSKAEKAAEITEDDLRGGEAEVQKLTDKYIAKIDDAFKAKEAELMEV
ncbi:MAG: ribosome recycling factor [Eggerthellaceae bacterium]|nr:ribosome recycling factor [Eggerthellaceae bacterium]